MSVFLFLRFQNKKTADIRNAFINPKKKNPAVSGTAAGSLLIHKLRADRLLVIAMIDRIMEFEKLARTCRKEPLATIKEIDAVKVSINNPNRVMRYLRTFSVLHFLMIVFCQRAVKPEAGATGIAWVINTLLASQPTFNCLH